MLTRNDLETERNRSMRERLRGPGTRRQRFDHAARPRRERARDARAERPITQAWHPRLDADPAHRCGYAVRDGNLITGQQNSSGGETARLLVDGLAQKKPFGTIHRVLGSAFAGALHLQVVLGILMVLMGRYFPALIGHMVMMVLAAIIAQTALSVNRRRATTATKTRYTA